MQDRACEAEVVLCGSQVSECRPVGVIERRGDMNVPFPLPSAWFDGAVFLLRSIVNQVFVEKT